MFYFAVYGSVSGRSVQNNDLMQRTPKNSQKICRKKDQLVEADIHEIMLSIGLGCADPPVINDLY